MIAILFFLKWAIENLNCKPATFLPASDSPNYAFIVSGHMLRLQLLYESGLSRQHTSRVHIFPSLHLLFFPNFHFALGSLQELRNFSKMRFAKRLGVLPCFVQQYLVSQMVSGQSNQFGFAIMSYYRYWNMQYSMQIDEMVLNQY